jgi:hypothetical protein
VQEDDVVLLGELLEDAHGPGLVRIAIVERLTKEAP